MALFRELDPTQIDQAVGGRIAAIIPDSLAAEIGLQADDELLAVNNEPVEDVIDVQFYGADEELELLIRRDGEYLLFEAVRDYGQELGIEFTHPTFDIDIRRCNNLCEFCFVLQMAPRFRRTLYIKDDDYRYSFLFGHFVTLTNLSDHDWWRIETMRLSPLYISVHVTDTELRRRFLRNNNAPDVMEQLRWLAERDIEMHTQLVVVPGFNDGPHLERSLAELVALWPAVQSVSVVPVGLTKNHKYGMRPHTKEEAAAALDFVLALQPQYQAQFGVNFAYPTDEWYLVAEREVPEAEAYDGQALHENGLGMVRYFLDEWQEVQAEIAAWLADHPGEVPGDGGRICLVTGMLFAPLLERAGAEFGALTTTAVQVQSIHNERLGGTITTAGLLMATDVIEQLIPHQAAVDLFVLPRIMFDHPDRISLDDLTPAEVATRLQRPVALADTMGDVWDALLGNSQAMHYPEAGESNE